MLQKVPSELQDRDLQNITVTKFTEITEKLPQQNIIEEVSEQRLLEVTATLMDIASSMIESVNYEIYNGGAQNSTAGDDDGV